MANKAKQAECPKCKKRALQIEYIAEKFASYELMENGVEGECGWQEFDGAEEFIDKLLNAKVKPDA